MTQHTTPDPSGVTDRAGFARELTLLREQADLTVREVAAKVGVLGAHTTIGGWCAGRSLPSASSRPLLINTLTVLGVSEAGEMQAWLAAWRRVRRSPGPRPGGPDPYRGLASFQPDDADWFFGRQELTDQLVEQVAAAAEAGGAVRVVVGASGAGKSSLLRAGLIPALRTRRLAGSGGGKVVLLSPGAEPLAELARALCEITGDEAEDVLAELREDPARAAGLYRSLQDCVHAVLVVDQFEEVFTACADPLERDAFISAVCAVGSPTGGAVVVLGVRADFYAQVLAYPSLLDAVRVAQITVGPMGHRELRQVIEEPARKAKVDVEDGLVDLLLREAMPGHGDAAVLPLLSHALYATWEQGQGRKLTIAGYRATGGIAGAVATSAERVHAGLGPAERQAARRLFLRLVHVASDTADTRRRASTSDLVAGVAEAEDVLEAFIDERLITASTDTMEISHEALMGAWPRLRGWLDADRSGLIVGQRLTTAATAWLEHGQEADGLHRGARLAAARDWAAGHPEDLSPVVERFLGASVRHERRRTRRLYQVVAALTALALAAVALAAVAFQQGSAATSQRYAAMKERNQAVSRLVAGRADELREADVPLAMQLSLAAYRVAPTVEARSSLLDSYAGPGSTRLAGFTGPVQAVAFHPGHTILAAASVDHTVRIWDTHGPAVPRPVGDPLTGPSQGLFALAFSTDGRLLAAAGTDRKIWLWDTTTPDRPTALGPPLEGPASTVYSLAFHPTRRLLAAGSDDHTVRLWDLSEPSSPRAQPALIQPAGAVQAVAFSPDGRTLAAAGADKAVHRWDLADPFAPSPLGTPLTGPTLKIYSLAFSPDSRTLAAGAGDRTTRLWDLTDRVRPVVKGSPLTGPQSWINALVFSPDGSTLAGGSSDNAVTEWDPATSRALRVLPHPAAVTSITYGLDGGTLVTGGIDATVRIWALPGPVLVGHTDSIFNAAYRGDGHLLATVGSDRTVRLWNTSDTRRPTAIGAPLTSPDGSSPFVGALALSPSGRTLAVGTHDGPIQLWDITHPEQPEPIGAPLTGPAKLIESLAFSPDGRTLAAGSDDTRAWLFDITDPARPALLSSVLGESLVLQVAFSPDGRTLALASADTTARLFDLADPAKPRPLGQPLTGFSNYVYTVAFSPDGRILAAGSADKTMRLWSLADREHPAPLGGPITGPSSKVYWAAFSPDGTTLAAANSDKTIWLYDVSRPDRPTPRATLTRPTGGVLTIAFSPDGRTLTAAGSDNTARTWDVDPERVASWICATAGAPITAEEWHQHVPDAPYQPPCPR